MCVRAKHGHWQGKVVFITGAAQGIGRATALVSPTAATVDTYPRSLPVSRNVCNYIIIQNFYHTNHNVFHWNNCYLLVYVYILLSLFLASSDQKRFLVLASLHVYLDVFDVDIFIGPCFICTDPELNVVSSRLWQVLTEPVGSVTALLSFCQTAVSVPEAVIRGVGVSAFSVTEVVISNE